MHTQAHIFLSNSSKCSQWKNVCQMSHVKSVKKKTDEISHFNKIATNDNNRH